MNGLFKKSLALMNAHLLLTAVALLLLQGCYKWNEKPVFQMTNVATGLAGPISIESDRNGNIWVTEGGTAKNDGKVIVITPDGKKYDAIVKLSSIINEGSGEVQGTAHLLMDKDVLYVLSGNYLYTINVAGYKVGQDAIDASKLPFEDIGAFVLSHLFKNNYNDSHPYNLIKGPDGHLYIVDAGANAIIHRKSAGNYSVLAEVP